MVLAKLVTMRVSRTIAWALLVIAVGGPARAGADASFAKGRTWGLEVALGAGWVPSTPYTERLAAFGYEQDKEVHFRWSVGVEKIVLPYFSVLLQTNLLDSQQWRRPSGIGPDDEFHWATWTLDAHARAFIPIDGGKVRLYAQVGLGPTFTSSRLEARTSGSRDQTSYRDVQVRYNVTGLLGVELLMGDRVGFLLQGGYVYAPAPKNRLGDVHQGGGLLLAGLGIHFGRER